ncbi:fructose-specific PTS transporter subunit EIIC [Corynebacterium sp. TAE3-ERU30]|uniref:PTS fructose transporter subunit IIABC n=1 Tax=Corynebacterium sp. TAE3-ERU30 TaxID=2849496 RepID=UPI001C46F37A|nr:fructose-specific PTS transporter subunit EIIC [Corynebacterium sp. TAE3-ERU30]MBV7281070.1 fructose-specific PTS transporter subunit EIIC [Corynebacterium sp. TAE3-ERU30]
MTDSIITESVVSVDVDLGARPADVISALATRIADAGRASSAAALADAALARESSAGTGVAGRVAIPHCRSSAVTEPTVAFARLSRPVDFSGPDGDADLIFLIAAPEDGNAEHMRILSRLARALVQQDFRTALRDASSREDVVHAVTAALATTRRRARSTTSSPQPRIRRIVAVTACPTGIAHTYMAADALKAAAAERADVDLQVEAQGSSSLEPLDPAVIAAADAVIFASDVGIHDRQRFAATPVVESGVKRAINEPATLLDEALAAADNPAAPTVAEATSAAVPAARRAGQVGWPMRMQQAVMTGVSYMIPFVAAGGLLLALGYLVGGVETSSYWQSILAQYSLSTLPPAEFMSQTGAAVSFDRPALAVYIGAVLIATGQAAMSFIVAALSGYIAYALADRPGIAPGFVGGAISVAVGAGFIGGLITGLIAGAVSAWIASWRVPQVLRSLMPVVIIPLLSTLSVGLVMFLLLARPLEAVMTGLRQGLAGMSESSAVLLGIVLGVMMCVDLGGPVNKAAYLFATAGLSTGDQASLHIMAAVMAAGMVPPLALSLATWLRASAFSTAEVDNGKSAWVLGLSFISEGAIPFAAADPLRVIPSMMAGGAVTGALSMGLGVASHAPHGGIFVLFAITPMTGFLVSLLAGVTVSTVCVIATKTLIRSRSAPHGTTGAGSGHERNATAQV